MSPRSTAQARAGATPRSGGASRSQQRASSRAARAAAARRRRSIRRRRAALVLVAIVSGIVSAAVVVPRFGDAVHEFALPLQHEDIIRQQAREKDLDPALIAAVIFAESHFRDQTSHAGARGLMQITPATADYIAQKSGGVLFETKDLATPQVNISYGAYYLRYLLRHYDGNTTLALAAYNGGEGNVDGWRAQAQAEGHAFGLRDIPFAETRHYVEKVLDARHDYRENYAAELGL